MKKILHIYKNALYRLKLTNIYLFYGSMFLGIWAVIVSKWFNSMGVPKNITTYTKLTFTVSQILCTVFWWRNIYKLRKTEYMVQMVMVWNTFRKVRKTMEAGLYNIILVNKSPNLETKEIDLIQKEIKEIQEYYLMASKAKHIRYIHKWIKPFYKAAVTEEKLFKEWQIEERQKLDEKEKKEPWEK